MLQDVSVHGGPLFRQLTSSFKKFVIALFGQMGGERLALFVEVRDDESLDVGHFGIGWAWWLGDILGGGRKEKEV